MRINKKMNKKNNKFKNKKKCNNNKLIFKKLKMILLQILI
jgi:hypothetical protein